MMVQCRAPAGHRHWKMTVRWPGTRIAASALKRPDGPGRSRAPGPPTARARTRTWTHSDRRLRRGGLRVRGGPVRPDALAASLGLDRRWRPCGRSTRKPPGDSMIIGATKPDVCPAGFGRRPLPLPLSLPDVPVQRGTASWQYYIMNLTNGLGPAASTFLNHAVG